MIVFRFLSVLVLSISFPVLAGESEALEVLIITAPLHSKVSNTAHPVNVLAGDDLLYKQASTLGETLQQELGIHNMSFGSSVGQVVIRGQMGNRVQVLQNGLSSLDVSGISPDHANSTEAALAEQIEVIRGPASLLYGSGAIGGVVNVIDNRIPLSLVEKPSFTFEQRYDSAAQQWNSVLKQEGSYQKFAWHLDGFFRRNDDYSVPRSTLNPLAKVSNTDAQSWSGTLGGSWIEDWGVIGFSVNHLDNNYGVPPVDETVRIDMQQTRYDLRAELYQPFSWIETLKLRFAYNDYQHTELEDGVTAGTQFDNQGMEGRIEAVHTALGMIDHGVLGFQAHSKEFIATGAEAFLPPSSLQSYGVFLLEEINQGGFTYELGLRVEHQDIEVLGGVNTQHTPVNASFSVLWGADEPVFLSLAFTHAQRAPDAQELFADGVHFASQSYELGAADLSVETSYNLELGFRTEFDWIRTELNVFHNWSKQYISQQRTGEVREGLAVYQAMQGDARFYGFEAQVTLPVWQEENHQFDLTLFGDYVRGELIGLGNVPRIPPLRYGFQLDYSGYDVFTADLRLTRAENQAYAGEFDTETSGYLLLDAKVAYKMNAEEDYDLLVFIKANNLLNETIRNSSSFLKDIAPEKGRGVELGIRVGF